MSKGWFYEIFSMGEWRPRWSLQQPRVKDGRVHTLGGGPGPLIRNLKQVARDDLKKLQREHGEGFVFRTRRNKDAVYDRG